MQKEIKRSVGDTIRPVHLFRAMDWFGDCGRPIVVKRGYTSGTTRAKLGQKGRYRINIVLGGGYVYLKVRQRRVMMK